MKVRTVITKFFKACLTLTIVALLFVVGCNLLVTSVTAEKIFTTDNADELSGDCILVLGCGLRRDGSPSQMLRDRLDAAIEAYNLGFSDRLLMSGDHGRPDYDEVNVMKDYAIAAGIPSDRIFMDHAGFSTYESMIRAKDIFQCRKIIVVTQKYHLYRAVYNAQALGMEATGLQTVSRAFAKQPIFDIREALARTKDVLWCLFKPAPTYGGEAIPIMSSSGDITNDQ